MYGFWLVASSCSGGYSMVKSPFPIVLSTCTMEWHDVQARPALRLRRIDLLFDRAVEAAVEEDGVIVASRAPLAGLRARPPICMYSIDFR